MSAGDGILLVTSALYDMANAALTATDRLQQLRGEQARKAAADKAAADRATAFGPTWTSGSDLSQAEADRQNRTGVGAGNTSVAGATGLGPLSPDVLDAEGFTKGSYTPGGSNVRQYDIQVANDFEDLAKRITAAYGKDNYIATVFATLAGFIREGRFSGAIGVQYAQGLIANFAAGFSQESTDPTSSPEMRALDAEMLRFISSGRI